MVVTSVYWLFFAVSISVLNIQSADSGKMTYGLVYRPAGLYSGSPGASAGAATRSSLSSSNKEKSKLESNETAISTITELPPDILESSISFNKMTQSNVSLDDDTGTEASKYTENDILPWLMQSAANPPYKPKTPKPRPVKTPHQYQVTEDDAEVEASDNEKQVDDHGDHEDHGTNKDEKEDKKEDNKKTDGSESENHNEEKKKGKEGKEGGKKKYVKKSGKKGSYKEKKKKKSKIDKFKKKKKNDDFKTEKEGKKSSSEKGFKNKYSFNKEDNVDEFWHSHHEKGVFRKFGQKKSSEQKADEAKKKKKKKKGKKKGKKTKKEGKMRKKEGHKEDSGFKVEKKNEDSYHREAEYGKYKKSKASKEEKKKKNKKTQ